MFVLILHLSEVPCLSISTKGIATKSSLIKLDVIVTVGS